MKRQNKKKRVQSVLLCGTALLALSASPALAEEFGMPPLTEILNPQAVQASEGFKVERSSTGISLDNPTGVTGDVGITHVDLKWNTEAGKTKFSARSNLWSAVTPFTIDFQTDKPLLKGQKVVLPLAINETVFNKVSSSAFGPSLAGNNTMYAKDNSFNYNWNIKNNTLTVTALSNTNQSDFKDLELFDYGANAQYFPLAAVPQLLEDGGDIANLIGTAGAGMEMSLELAGQTTSTTLTKTKEIEVKDYLKENINVPSKNIEESAPIKMRASRSGWAWTAAKFANLDSSLQSNIVDEGESTVSYTGVSNAEALPTEDNISINFLMPIACIGNSTSNELVPMTNRSNSYLMKADKELLDTVVSDYHFDAETNTHSYKFSRKAKDWANFAKVALTSSAYKDLLNSTSRAFLQRMAKDDNAEKLMPYVQFCDFQTTATHHPINWDMDMKVDFKIQNDNGDTYLKHWTVQPLKSGEADATKLLLETQYVDEQGKAIKDMESQSLSLGDTWSLNPPTIKGYKYLATNDAATLKILGLPNDSTGVAEATGEVVQENIGKINSVVMTYTNKGSVTAHFVDTAGKVLQEPLKVTGQESEIPELTAPSIKNYYLKTSPTLPAIQAGENQDITYVYDNQAPLTYSVIDDTTQTTLVSKTSFLTGQIGQEVNSTENQEKLRNIELPFLNKKYQVTSVVNGELSAPTNKEGYDIEIHLTHQTHLNEVAGEDAIQKVTPKEVTREIHYKGAGDKTPQDVVQKLLFKATVTQTIDSVTDEVLSEADAQWFAEGKTEDKATFNAVSSPNINGYAVDKASVSSLPVTHLSSNSSVEVTYSPKPSEVNIIYRDVDTHAPIHNAELTKQTLTGLVDQSFDNTAAYTSELKALTAKGYVLVHADSQEGSYTPEAQTLFVDLKHKVTTQADYQVKDITQTIHYKNEKGEKVAPDQTQVFHFTNGASIDEVTGEKLQDNWSVSQESLEVPSPQLEGYTADKEKVESQTYAYDSKDKEFEVVYKANPQKTIIRFLDVEGLEEGDYGKGQILNDFNQVLEGVSDEVYNNQEELNQVLDELRMKGYLLVLQDDGASEGAFDHDDHSILSYNVYLQHIKETVVGQKTKTVSSVIHYEGADKLTPPDNTQHFLFKATETYDKVTNEVLNTEWSAPQESNSVETPVIKGYEADKTSVPVQSFTADSDDAYTVVTYKKIKEATPQQETPKEEKKPTRSKKPKTVLVKAKKSIQKVLPQTGDKSEYKFILTGAFALLIAGLLYIKSRLRMGNKEN